MTYRGSGSDNPSGEWDPAETNVANVDVEESATLTLDDDYNATGDLTVAASAVIDDDGTDRILTLSGASAEHLIAGEVTDGGSAATTTALEVTGEDALVEGNAGQVGEVNDFVARAANVEIDGLNKITGRLDVDADFTSGGSTVEPSLTLGFATGPAIDQEVEGAITANNDLTLASDVTASGGVDVNATGDQDGSIALGEYDLDVIGRTATVSSGDNITDDNPAVVTLDAINNLEAGDRIRIEDSNELPDREYTITSVSGSDITIDFDNSGSEISSGNGSGTIRTPFSGESGTEFTAAGGGDVLFDGDDNQRLSTAGETIPTVVVESSSGSNEGITLAGDAATDNLLDIDNSVSLRGNDFDVEGKVEVAADVSHTSGALRTVGGTEVALESDQDIAAFTVASGSGNTTTLASADNTAKDLTVSTQFTLNSGEFAHGQNDLSITNDSDGAFTYVDGSVSATTGFVDLDAATLDFALGGALSIPNLQVSQNADAGDDGQDLTVANELHLDDATFTHSGPSNSNRLIVGESGGDVPTLEVSSTGALSSEPESFGQGKVDYLFSGTSVEVDENANFFASGAPARDIELNHNRIDISSVTDADPVVITLNEAGNLQIGDRIRIEGNSEIPDGEFTITDTENGSLGSNKIEIPFDNTDGAGSATDGQVVANTTFEADRSASGDLDLTEGVLDIDDDAGTPVTLTFTGTTFTRNDEGSVQLDADGDGNTGAISASDVDLIYEGDEAISTGPEYTEPSSIASFTQDLDADLTIDDARTIAGDVTLNQGALQSRANTTVEGAYTSNNVPASLSATLGVESDVSLNAAADFTGGGTLELDGSNAQTLSPGAANITANVEIDNAAGVSLSDQNLNFINTGGDPGDGGTLVLSEGLLTVPSDLRVTLDHDNTGDQGFSRPQGGGYIVGDVRKPITQLGSSNANRLDFPTGNSEGDYRPAAVTFNDPTQVGQDGSNISMTIRHVNALPGGSSNLPVTATDDQGNEFDIGRYPEFYWAISTSSSLSPSVSYDVELQAANYTNFKTEDINRLRVIRRQSGQETNDWSNAGDGSGDYDNFEISDDEPAAVVRDALGALTRNGTLFSYGLESNFEVAQEIGDQTISETGTTVQGPFLGSSADDGQSGIFEGGTGEYSFSFSSSDSDVATASADQDDNLSIQSVGSGTATLTVDATDQLGDTATETFQVTVNAGPAFTTIPSQATAVDTGRTSENPTTIDVTAEVDDPGSGDVTFDTDPSWTSVTSTTDNGDGTFDATIALEPGFDQAQTFEQSGNAFALTVTATDQGTGQNSTRTVSVDVEFDRGVGDVSGDGRVRADDALDALDISVGNRIDVDGDGEGEKIIRAQERAADFNEDGDVRASDALAILNAAGNGSSAAAATASSSSAGSAGGAIYLGDPEVENGVASYPVMLSQDASGVNAADVTLSVDQGKVTGVETQLSGNWMSAQNTLDDGTVKLAMAGQGSLAGQQVATVTVKTGGDASDVEPGGQYRLNSSQVKDLEVRAAPDQFALNGSYPNPVTSSGQATIEMDLPSRASVTVEVYNVLGQRVQTLEQSMTAGEEQSIKVDASTLSSGQYFYRVNAELESGSTVTETRQMTVVR